MHARHMLPGMRTVTFGQPRGIRSKVKGGPLRQAEQQMSLKMYSIGHGLPAHVMHYLQQ